jgi:hypothetical protein
MKLPSGPGAAAADAADAIADATAECRTIKSITAEIAVSGSVGGQRLRGHLLAGLAQPASARLEAVAPAGPPLFIFVAMREDATLLLPRDGRVLQHGRPAEVLEAIAGVPLDPTDLRMAFTGCTQAPDPEHGRQFGADWRVVPDGPNQLYLHREPNARWRLVAAVHRREDGAGRQSDQVRVKADAMAGGSQPSRSVRLQPDQGVWRAEYADFEDNLPRSIRLVSADRSRFDLRLKLSQVETNVELGADVFTVRIPQDADPISLDELRRSRPGVREN